jgi:hypothetical protein
MSNSERQIYTVCDSDCDYNYLRYAGWTENNACIKQLYSKETVDLISKKVTQLTLGVDPKNRKIIVPKDIICKVLDGVYHNNRPPTGDIFSRYIIPNNEQQNVVQSIIDQTIEIIVSSVRNNMEMNQYNETLTAWVQVYGDFNTAGLRQHAPIKIRERRPATMQFNMRY